jgi:DNA-binding NtrC family response regulator
MAETLSIHAGGLVAMSLKSLVEDYERRLIEQALERARGNQRRAAAELGCLPTTLNEKMRRLGMRACDRSRDELPGEETRGDGVGSSEGPGAAEGPAGSV